MALSLRRANAVKDALVRDGVPAQAIVVIGREPAADADRRRRARASEPPRRDCGPVGARLGPLRATISCPFWRPHAHLSPIALGSVNDRTCGSDYRCHTKRTRRAL